MKNKDKKLKSFEKALEVMDRLREECPWNRAQTNESLRPMTLEEVYELSDAVLKKEEDNLKKELGDVFLHIMFYSRIAEEEGRFDIADVMDKLCEKMIYRHPHVFSDTKAADAEEVSTNWEMLKAKEKGGNRRILSGIPDSMPTVLKAYSMQAELEALDKASTEDEAAAARGRAEEELGDFMFATINAARLYGLDPDTALNRACDKFRRRFTYLEEKTIRQGRDLHDMTLEQMDEIWDEAKARGL